MLYLQSQCRNENTREKSGKKTYRAGNYYAPPGHKIHFHEARQKVVNINENIYIYTIFPLRIEDTF